MSPFWTSAFAGMRRSSIVEPSPEPKATPRRPLRTTCTGTAWSFSVTSVTSARSGCTRVTWPTTPAPSITGWPAATPCWPPLSMITLRVNGLRAGVHDLGEDRVAGEPLARRDQELRSCSFSARTRCEREQRLRRRFSFSPRSSVFSRSSRAWVAKNSRLCGERRHRRDRELLQRVDGEREEPGARLRVAEAAVGTMSRIESSAKNVRRAIGAGPRWKNEVARAPLRLRESG